jgi:hypothetical protein
MLETPRKIPALLQTASSGKELARQENINEGFCPVCNTPMKPTIANGIRVVACLTHSIVMPVRD